MILMSNGKQLYAHFRASDTTHREPHYLMDHLLETSDLTGQFAHKVGLADTGKVLGLLHDLGKASDEFQKYLLSGEGLINPDADGYIDPKANRGKIDHSTAGAQILYDRLWDKGIKERYAAQIIALCIASHHSGTIDCLKPDGDNNFKRRMDKPEESSHKAEVLSKCPKINLELKKDEQNVIEELFNKLKSLTLESNTLSNSNTVSREVATFKSGLLIRYLLSCLVDADRLSTCNFETPNSTQIRNYGKYPAWDVLLSRLENKINEFESKKNKNFVDLIRMQVSQACLDHSSKPTGIYQLTVPTGGGKTLASLRFAINHANHHPIDRIFYIIPYTSIIDQNAEEIRKIVEDKDESGKYVNRIVLEHHSNLTPDEETYRQRLLAENWDAPIVFTTQVQFFEALFGSGTRSIRRMHQLARSIIIIDEVQTIPINCLHMLNTALRFLVNDCGSTVILCTATQPPLSQIDNKFRALALSSDNRIISDEKALFNQLKRVEVFDHRKPGGWSDEEVSDLALQQVQENGSVLVVVNTKKSARSLYNCIAKRYENLYHLSTNMCPAHRMDILSKIKKDLAEKKPVVCISTQLIEAGVDIDFGAVIRYIAGLDSIAQSAGRCNRHGTQASLGKVWVINPKDEMIDFLKNIKIGQEQAERVLNDFKRYPELYNNDIIGMEAMAEYYNYYFYEQKDEMRYKVKSNSAIGRDDDLFNILSINKISNEEHTRKNSNSPHRLPFTQSFQSAARMFQVIDSATRGIIVQYNEGKDIVTALCNDCTIEEQSRLLRNAQRYSVNLFNHEFIELNRIGAIIEIRAGTGIYYLDDQYYSDKYGWSDERICVKKLLMI